MAINKLYVEGDLDRQLLLTLLSAQPGVAYGGGKDEAHRKTAKERGNGQATYYLRDRDFDDDPSYTDIPQQIIVHEQLLGWNWSRHEIENYFLEPELFSLAFSERVTYEEVHQELLRAAQSIRFYQMARWAVGRVRRFNNLPTPRRIQTKPSTCRSDYQLPANMDYEHCANWAISSTAEFLQTVIQNVSESAIQNNLAVNAEQFTPEKCQDLHWVLHTFSGKDLFGSMKEWLESRLSLSPKQVCNRMVAWIDQNQEKALRILPEWKALLDQIRST